MLVAARAVVQRDLTTADQSAPIPAVEGYRVQRIANDVVKLENDQSLVYIKPITGFYSADHNPMICWRGSGYAFTRVEKSPVNGVFVYMALLQNGQDQLYTAWWYDNGVTCTIDQLTWRRDALQNKTKYALINVTATSREKLEAGNTTHTTGTTLQEIIITSTAGPAVINAGKTTLYMNNNRYQQFFIAFRIWILAVAFNTILGTVYLESKFNYWPSTLVLWHLDRRDSFPACTCCYCLY